jgi:hypothetical protein
MECELLALLALAFNWLFSKLVNENRELLMHLDFSYLSYNELNNYLKHAVFPNAGESERQTDDLIAYDDQSGF